MKSLPCSFAGSRRISGLTAGLLLTLAASWQAEAQVSLISVQPANGATEVPVNASVIFTFSKQMDETTLIILAENQFFNGSLSFTGTGISASSFTPTWNEEFTSVSLNYGGNLPPGTVITWTLNPANRLVTLASEDADLLPTTTGSFTTGGEACDPDGIPDDYGSAIIFKSVTYRQTSATAPVLDTEQRPNFLAIASSPADNAVTAASITYPGPGSPAELTGVFGQFLHLEEFDSQAELDAAYPSGTYTYSLTRQTGGPTEFSMNMPVAGSYPPVPQVGNFAAAQTIDPAQNFTLQFNALTGASGGDYIQLEIEDEAGSVVVLSAPDLCVPLELPNTATSFTIPAGTLTEGKTYVGRLTFGRSFYRSTTSPPNFGSSGSLNRQTVFALTTTGGVVVPQPQITSEAFQSGFYGLTIGNLEAGTTYRVQYSTTLAPGSWNLLQTVTTATPMPIFDLDSSATSGQRFYRVITP
ncbi:MAG TPA: Ig-like domain-containing protein [Verrucomicrobiae bacterium]|nr:Ig-like domain-containing protein [Verrucomicrobiae bacterium]